MSEGASLGIFYVAPGVRVPGGDGGSSHTAYLTSALAKRGHRVTAWIRGDGTRGTRDARQDETRHRGDEHHDGVLWLRRRGLFMNRYLEWTATARVEAEAQRIRPDVVIERYSSFGGAGVRAAGALGLPALLEVNSPAFDPPGSWRGRVDGLVPGHPVRRYRESLLARAAGLYATSPLLVPEAYRGRFFRTVSNGFDPERFGPEGERASLPFPSGAVVFTLVSSFRAWHGARELVAASAALARSGRRDFGVVLVGDGPERSSVLEDAARAGIAAQVWAPGHVAPDRVPAILRASHVGVAPFATARHSDLSIGFFWSPIKLFEYMGSGLAIITTRVPPLAARVRDQVDGLLVGDGVVEELESAMRRFVDTPGLAATMGAAARQRALAEFTWDAQARIVEALALEAIAEGQRRNGRCVTSSVSVG